MKKQYQVTIMCRNGKYKPVSCIISMEQMEDVDYTVDKEKKRLIKNLGVTKICQQRYWTINDLKKYDYTKVLHDMIKKKLTQKIKLDMKPLKKRSIKAASGKDLRARLDVIH